MKSDPPVLLKIERGLVGLDADPPGLDDDPVIQNPELVNPPTFVFGLQLESRPATSARGRATERARNVMGHGGRQQSTECSTHSGQTPCKKFIDSRSLCCEALDGGFEIASFAQHRGPQVAQFMDATGNGDHREAAGVEPSPDFLPT